MAYLRIISYWTIAVLLAIALTNLPGSGPVGIGQHIRFFAGRPGFGRDPWIQGAELSPNSLRLRIVFGQLPCDLSFAF